MDDDFTIRENIRTELVMNDGHALETLDSLGRLMAAEGEIFQQGSGRSFHGVVIHELSAAEVKALRGADPDKPRVVASEGLLMPVPLTPAHIQDFAEHHFDVVKARRNPRNNEAEMRPADFRQDLARRFIDSKRLRTLRPLLGVAYTPILRPDGSIVSTPGYDWHTALWVVGTVPHIQVPASPTIEDCKQAITTLDELIAEHVFETDHDKASAIGFLMAAALRPSMRSSPLLVADAPDARTGKDYLLCTVALIATGHPPVEFALSDSAEEQQKRMGSALLMGAPFLTLNNINGRLRSTDLTIYLTQGGVVTRAYATTGGAAFAPNGNIIAASGNNIILGGDLPERAFISRQDARVAFPGERRFKADPHAMVLADRGKYLSAIFTIARWAIRGADYAAPDLTGFGGFDDFDKLIRCPLYRLTNVDPADRGKEQIVAERENRWQVALIDALALLFKPGEPFRTKDVTDGVRAKYVMPGDTDALAALRRDDLAYSLRRAKGARGTDLRLVGIPRPKGGEAVAWYHLEAASKAPDAGGKSEGLGVSEGFPSVRGDFTEGVFPCTSRKTPSEPLSPKTPPHARGVVL